MAEHERAPETELQVPNIGRLRGWESRQRPRRRRPSGFQLVTEAGVIGIVWGERSLDIERLELQAGKRIVKVEPVPGRLVTLTAPP